MFRWGLLAWLVATPVLAQEKASPGLDDLMHARNLAMGGAYRSLGYGAESVGGNPAAIAMFKRYQVEASGTWWRETQHAQRARARPGGEP